jgi:membrane associated rhomboid family serine protease
VAEEADLKQCPHCRGWIPAVATMCAQCGSSKLDAAPAPRAPEVPPAMRGVSVTTVLIWANVAFLVFSLLVQWRLKPGGNALQYLLPGPSGKALAIAGLYDHHLVARGQWWRVVTATFLHAGLLHIGFNMYALHQLGPITEHLIGKARFLVVYVVCAICSTLAISIWFVHVQGDPGPHRMVGASGAVFGILGVLITFLRRKGNLMGRAVARSLAINAVILIAIGIWVPMISNTGHMGGLLPGLVFGMVLSGSFADRLDPAAARRWGILALLAALVTLVALGAGVAFAVRYLAQGS